jgi:hypothetical protein
MDSYVKNMYDVDRDIPNDVVGGSLTRSIRALL